MKFRPCIDLHNGRVKQIVGSSLRDEGDRAAENFVSDKNAAWYAEKYRADGLAGGHVILLNSRESAEYASTLSEALAALAAWPGGMQAGGGIRPDNAGQFLKAGASRVIVTSYVFPEGELSSDRLREMCRAVGREHLTLDLSCRRRDGRFWIVTDRWQKFSRETVNVRLLENLSEYCSEFLIHGVDSEGKRQGVETDLLALLGEYEGLPVTYAGGVRSLSDCETIRRLGKGKIDFTVGSALDLFGGSLPYEELKARYGVHAA